MEWITFLKQKGAGIGNVVKYSQSIFYNLGSVLIICLIIYGIYKFIKWIKDNFFWL